MTLALMLPVSENAATDAAKSGSRLRVVRNEVGVAEHPDGRRIRPDGGRRRDPG
jgi:hypothetical protein